MERGAWSVGRKPVRDFTELEVYQISFEGAKYVYRPSKGFPGEEKYSLTDQIRRCTRSVCTSIAEAWRKRRYQAALVAKLSDADGESTETLVWLDFALDAGYLTPEVHGALRDRYDHVCRMLTRMMQDSATWCGPRSS